MPYVYDIKIDFHSDWIQVMQIALTNLGYSADESLPSDRLSFQFFNVQSRLISPVPRKILLAKDFHCPPAHQNGLEMLKSKIIAGDPLNPYQSKGIRSLTNNDALLNDWGIHHLHLGTIEENGFVNRTGPVLFARFDNEHAYFYKGHGPWEREQTLDPSRNDSYSS